MPQQLLLPELDFVQRFMLRIERMRLGFRLLGQASPLPGRLWRVRSLRPNAQAPVLGGGGGRLPVRVEGDHEGCVSVMAIDFGQP